jgi:OmcA/MtrC family decaheme c-type cytochrome
MRLATAHRVALVFAVLSFACSGDDGDKGSSCTVKELDAGAAEIRCDDGTSAVVPGAQGGCTVKENSDGTKTISCGDGTTVSVSDGEKGDPGPQGEKGGKGADGAKGDTGADGRSAYVVGAGLKIEIESVSIPDDLQPLVKLHMRDANDQPLDRSGKLTPGAVSVSFVLAKLTSSGGKVGEYAPYNVATVNGATVGNTPPALANAMQPKSENNGTWTELDPNTGTYSYRFNQALPSDYDKSKTHTVAIYASRTFAGAQYASNPIFQFRPDGEAVSEKRELITTAGCNACHGTLLAHGGSRRETGLCITCHVGGMNDPESGNSIEMAQMIHKLHSGEALPSVVGGTPYKIVGFNNSVNDYSHVVFPQARQNCATCHKGADADRWKTTFTRTACGACHDRTSFVSPAPSGFTLHSGGQQSDDSLCANCHAEGKGPIATLDTDVIKVHKRLDEMPLRDLNSGAVISTAPHLSGEVLSVMGTGPTDIPVVSFRVKVDDMPYDILASGKALDRLRFTFSGPTTDYAGYSQFVAQGTDLVGTLAAGANPGEFTWTAPAGQTLTAIATTCGTTPSGSFAVGMEGRLKGMATQPNGMNVSVNYPMHNPVFFFAVTDAQAVPRREAVVVANCNNCHEDLAAHGGSRNDPQYCALCHTANKDTTNIPAPSAGSTKLTTSLRLSHMVHRIHTGEDGASEYIVGSNDFSKVLFPADLRNCTLCHVPAQYTLPLPKLLPSYMTQIDSTKMRVPSTTYYMQATAAACNGCHDSTDAMAHTDTMTTAMGVESCTTCHATGSAYDVDLVHARPGL